MKLLDALHGKNEGRPPVWLMRQAGRYMPSYQKLRQRYTIDEMFRNADIIAEVTRMPIDQLGVDAAIIYTDILILLDLFGVNWTVESGIGPVVESAPLERRPIDEAIPFLGDAMRNLDLPLIGFCGAPFTVASYLIEGKPSKTLSKIRTMVYREPEQLHLMLETLTEGAIDLLRYQIAHGAVAIQIFDSWAHWLPPEAFDAFSVHYVEKIAQSVDVPVIRFARGPLSTRYSGPIGLDWQHNLKEVRKHTSRPLQGNIDPCLLYAAPNTIRKTVTNLLTDMKDDPAYIFNLGHGLLPDTPYDHVKLLVDTVLAHA